MTIKSKIHVIRYDNANYLRIRDLILHLYRLNKNIDDDTLNELIENLESFEDVKIF